MIRTFTLHTALTLLTICSAALQALAQPSAPELPPWVIEDSPPSLAMADPPGTSGPSALIDQVLPGTGYLEKLEYASPPAERGLLADATICYAVDDGGNNLVSIKRDGLTASTVIGNTGVNGIEAAELSLDGNTLYAANFGTFGTINLTTGTFSAIGVAGVGGGAAGNINFSDLDGLAIDPQSGVMYASHRYGDGTPPEDVLLAINIATGNHIPNFFGPGIDYVVIKTASLATPLYDVDDIAINPVDGQMYGVANNNGTADRLIRINKATGTVTDVGRITKSTGGNLDDVEGFSFYNDGTFYITTGDLAGGADANALWTINTTTAVATKVRNFDSGSDYEGVGCLTGGSNLITGKVFDDQNGDGTFNGTDVGQAGVQVILYIDQNNDGLVDGGDTQIQTATTNASGDYEFEVSFFDNFVIAINTGTLPPNSVLTTDNHEEADFLTTFGNTDSGNNFGFARSADLSLDKTASPLVAAVGANVTFTVTVSNAGPAEASGVSVRDILPAGVAYFGQVGDGSYNPVTGIWTLPNIPNGGSASIDIEVTVLQSGPITNRAQILTSNNPDPDSTPGNNIPGDDDDDSVTITGLSVDLSLSKTVDNDMPKVGEQVTFTLTVTNSSAGPATGVTVSDPLPPEFTFVSATGTGTYSAGIWNIGTVPANSSVSIDITVTVTGGFAVPNEAQIQTVNEPDPDSTPGNDDPDEDDQSFACVVIPIELSTGADYTLTAPGGLADYQWYLDGNPISGATSQTYVVQAPNIGVYTYTAMDPAGCEYNEDCPISFIEAQVDLELTKAVDISNPNVGQTVTFTLTLTNNDNAGAITASATGVTVQDILPAGYTYSAGTISFDLLGTGASVSTNDGGAPSLEWTVNNLDPGESIELSFQATVNAPPSAYENAAQVTAANQSDIDSNPNDGMGDDYATASTTPQQSDLSLAKSASPATPNVGDVVAFTIQLSNAGPNPATGVSVADVVPAGYGSITGITGGGTASGNTISWAGLSVPVGTNTVTLTFQATVLAPTGAPDEYKNVAQVTAADQFDPDSDPNNLLGNTPAEDDEDDAAVVPQQSDLSLAKSVSPANPNVGQTVTFTIQLSNAGPNPATGVSVADVVPAGYGAITGISGGGSLSGSTITWTGLSVPVGSNTVTLTFQATVLAPTGAPDEYKNVAQVTDSDQFDPDSDPNNLLGNTPAEDDEDDAAAVPQQSDLSLEKLMSTTAPKVGDVVTFTINISNAGPDAASGVSVSDVVPAGYSAISGITGGGTLSGSTITWTGLSVPVGTNSVVLTFQATVDAPTGAADEYKNVAQVTASNQFDPDSQPNNLVGNTPAQDDESAITAIPQRADLSLNKTVSPLNPNVGGTVTFTITLTNLGPNAANSVSVEDYVPGGYSGITAISDGGTASGGTITWTGLSIPAFGTETLTFQAIVDAPTGAPNEYRNVAQITASDQFDPDSQPDNLVGNTPAQDDEDDATINQQQADLSLVKQISDATPNVGDVVTFTITLSNAGPNAASGVAVEDVVPDGFSGITAITGGGVLSGNTITWSGLAVPVGANTVSFTFQATVDAPTGAPGEYANAAEITAADQFDPDSDPASGLGVDDLGDSQPDDDESIVTAVPLQSDLSLDKTVSPASVNVGDVVTFTITLSNAGPDAASGVAVEDVVPAGYGSITGISGSGSLSGSTITWSGLSVPVGANTVTLTFQATVLVPTGAPNEYLNLAQVTASEQYDPNSTPDNLVGNTPAEDDEDSAAAALQSSNLVLSKTVSPTSPNVGDLVTFTIEVANLGPDAATNVVIEDYLPNGYSGITNISGGGMASGSTITWNLASIPAPGGANVVTLTFQATVEAPGMGVSYRNVAQVADADQLDPTSTPGNLLNNTPNEDDEDDANLTPQQADLRVVKSVNNATPNVGQVVTFTIQVTNDGPNTATGVSIEDVVPAGFSNITAIIPPGALVGNTITWSGLAIASGNTLVLSFNATVDAPTGAPGEYQNVARVLASDQFDPDSSPGNAADIDGDGLIGSYDPDGSQDADDEDDGDDAIAMPRQADLSLVKTVDNPTPNVGDVVTFTIALSNAGPNAAQGVAVEDVVPAGYSAITGIAGGGSLSGSTINWTNLSVPVGANALLLTYQATVEAPTGAPGEYQNVARIMASAQFDPNSTPGNAADSNPGGGIGPIDEDGSKDDLDENDADDEIIVPQQSDLSLAKAISDATPDVGQTVTFTITLSNAGPDAATGVAIEDLVPAGYSGISNISAGGSASGNTVTWSGLTVPVGANTLTLTFDAIVDAPTGAPNEYLNTAEITAADQFDPDSDPATGFGVDDLNDAVADDDEASVSSSPNLVDLSVQKNVSIANPNVGQTVTFTISVSNALAATASATGIVVEDVLPAGYAYVPGSISSIPGGTGAIITPNATGAPVFTWSINQLDPGESVILTLQAVVQEPTGAPNEYLNAAQVTDVNEYDTDSTPGDGMGDDYDTEAVTPKQIDVSLTNTVDDPTPAIGQTVTFTVAVTNSGPDAATNISVEDLIPAGYTYVGSSIGSDPNATGATITPNDADPTALTWTINQLDPGETVFLTFDAVVEYPTGTPDEYLTVAEVTAHTQDDVDSVPNDGMGDDYDTEAVTLGLVDVELTKDVDIATPFVGQTVTFFITVSNNANGGTITDAATGIVVEDVLPAGYTYVPGSISSIAGGTGAIITTNESGAPTLSWSIDQLDPAESVILSFQAVVLDPTGAPGEFDNPAEVIFQEQEDLDSDPTASFGVDDLNDTLADDDEAIQSVTPINAPPVAEDDSYVTDEDTPLNVPAPGVLDNDSDPDMDALTVTVLTPPSNGTLVQNPDGSFTYTPDPDFNGVDTYTYEACDPSNACDPATVTITVNPVDDQPVAGDDMASVPEDGSVNINPLPNDDFGGDGPSVGTINILTPPTNGTATVNDGGTPNDPTDDTIDYTPNPDYNGPDQIVYEICDFDGDCDPATIDITVDPVNDLPDAVDDPNEMTAEDTPVNIDVLFNDTFGGDGPSTGAITVTVQPTNGTATVNDGGTPNDPTDDTVDYTPNADYNGTDQFTYEICDSNGDCDQAVATITIDPVDDFPTAANDMVSTNEDSPLNINPLPNDDFGGDGPSTGPITIVTPPGNGTATVNDGGTPNDPTDDTIDYTPNPDYNGPDQIVYEICDFDGDCVQATIDITVDPVNDLPDAVDDPNEMTAEDTPVNIDVLFNDTFGGDGPSTGAITVVTPPSNGTAVVNDGGTPNDPSDDTVDYTPNADYNGTDQFTYEICDSNGDCDQAVATITIDPVDDFPSAADDMATVPEDGSVNIDPLPNDDFGGDGPSTGPITIVTPPGNGTATVNDGGTPNDPTDDTIDYTPDPDYNGPDQIVYEICDFDGDCVQATIDITVDPVNDVPDAVDDPNEMTAEDTPVNIDVLFNDTFGGDGPSMGAITVTVQPTNGTAVVNDGGTPNDPSDDTVDYTPNADYNGTDQFTYEICDSNGDCDQAVATITIDPVDDFPSATDDMASVPEDGSVNIGPLPNDDFGGDGPGDGPITIVTPPLNGTATVNDGGTPNDPTDDTIDYTPDPDYNGPDQIVYEICDFDGDCVQATIDITVDPVDDFPVAEDDMASTDEDTPVNIDPLPNDDFGGDGPSTGTINILTPPANGTATVNDGGTPTDPTDDTIDYTPDPDYSGPDQIVYEICDADGDCDPATIDITVNPVNDVPDAVDDPNTVINEDSPGVNIDVLANDDFGGDGPSMSAITIVTPPTNGTATVDDNGTPNDPTDDTVDYVPDPNFNGTDQFTYEICDSNGDCDQAVATITVNPVNDFPNAVNDPGITTAEDTPLNIDPLINDTFGGDGPSTGTITIEAGPINGTGTVNDGGTPNDPSDDTIDYTPNPNFSGNDLIVYQICDSNGDCDQATISITVTPVDDMPVAEDDMATVPEDGTVNVDPLANDDFGGDGPILGSIQIITPPTNGTATVNNGGTPFDPTDDTIDYTPDPDFNGTDQLTYRICDVDGDCDPAIITFDVTPVNDLPIAVDEPVQNVVEDMSANIDPLPNDDFGGDGPGTGTITIVTPPANGTATVNDGGTPNDPTDDTIDYTPNANYNGPDQIEYEICDSNGDCDQAIIPINVAPANDFPTAADDMASTDEDTPLNIDPLPNDDFGGDGPSAGPITIVTPPANGTATVNDGGTPNDPTDDTIDYAPDPDYNGPDQIVYEICDADGNCDQATIDISVNPVNDLPDAVNDPAEMTAEDTPVNIDVLFNDTFGGDGPSTGAITIVTPPTNGTATVNDGGTPNDPTDDTVDYIPNADYNGTDQFTYEICDSNGDCDQAVATINITPVDDFPTAADDMVSTNEDSPLNIDPLPNDDFGGDGPGAGTITIVTPPANGTATVNDGGTPNDPTDDTIDYTPDPDYNGPDQIVYEICDADGDCDPATIDITVDPVNDLPDAVDDPNETTAEDTPVNIDVLFNDTFGGDGPSMGAITIVTPPTNGTAVVNDGGTPNDPTDDTVDYTPNADYNGTDQFTYEICDSNGDCDQAVATINITSEDDFPSAANDMASVPEDGSVNIGPLPNDDFGGDGPSAGPITILTPPGNGTATVNDGGTPNDPTDDTIDYTPDPDYNGPDQIVYEICDLDGDCVQATIDITVDPVNDVPVAEDDMVSTDEDMPLNIDPLPNDDFGGDGPSTGTINILTLPANGTATVNDGGTPNDPTDDTIDYTPDPDYNGPDQIVYEICDADGDCDPATIDIQVAPVNDLPDAVDDPNETTMEDMSVNIDVLTNDDFGGDGPSMGAITVTVQPTNGTAVVNDGGTPNDPTDDTVDYTPDPDFFGTDQFTYEICDSNGDCDQAVATIDVTPVNDLPSATDDMANVPEDGSVNIDPLPNDDFGGDGPATGPITIVTPPANGTATVNNGGTPNDPTDDTIDYTPAPDYNGPDQIVYEICDANGDCVQATIDITVNPQNDVPVAVDDPNTVINEDSPGVIISVLNNDDFGGDGPSTGTITVVTQPTNGTATVNDGGTPTDPTDDKVTYVPDPNFNGTDQFTYEICDSDGDCDQAVATVTVNPINDFPNAVNDSRTTPEDTPININPLINDSFGGDGPSVGTIAIVGGSLNGTSTINDGGTPNDPTDDTIDYVPNPNFSGIDQIVYEICDSNGDCDVAIITVTITPVDDMPVAEDDMATVPEDGSVNVDPLVNDDFGGDGPSIGTIQIVTPPVNGTATVNNGGTPFDPTDDTIDYTPDPDFNGTDQLTYRICDVDGDCDPAIITFDVTPVNDLPTAVDEPVQNVVEDMSANIDPLPNDDFGGDGPSTGTITIVTQPTNGTATVNDGGTPNDPTDDTIDYTPNANYNGPDQIEYEICDSNGDCDQAIIPINVAPVNDFPTAVNDMTSTDEDTPVNIDPLPNDDFGGDGPSTGPITIFTPPANGTATVNDGGTPNDPTDDTIDYTPDPDFNGTDQITYEICDANGNCDQATITVTVNPVNDLPDAVDDPNETTAEDTPVNIDVLANDDFGGDGPSTGAITIVTPPTNGTATVNDGGTPNDPTDDTVDYIPNADYNGPDQFTYEICDSNGDCDQAVATIDIQSVDDFPTAGNDVADVPEDGSVNIDPLPNDDFGGDGPSVGPITIVTPPGNGTATVNDGGTPNDPTDDTIDYTPDPDYNGPDQIVYEICDADGDCVQATIDIDVDPVNDLPDAMDDPVTVTEDTPLNIDPLPNDDFGGDGPGMTPITIVTPPTNGTATVNDGGTPNDPTDDTIDYTPAPNYNGPDQIVYEICDSNGDCDQATIDITVDPVNEFPDAVDDPVTATEDTPLNIDPLPNDDFGGDGPSMTPITIVTPPTNGTATVNDGGTPNDPTDDTIDYTPNPDYNGPDQIVYEICDSNGDCDQATIDITVDPVNDLPDAMDDLVTVTEDIPLNIDPLPNDDFGGDGPSMTPITIVTPPTNGTAAVNDGGTPNDPTDDTIDYTPDPNYNGPDQIVYEICDSNGDCDQATIDITVDPVNEFPDAVDDPNETTMEDMSVNIDVLANDDFGGDGPSVGAIIIVTPPTNGTATVNDGGTPNDPTDDTVDYTPNTDYNGPDQFTYEICDSDGDCDQAVATIDITPVNDLPAAMDDMASVPEDGSLNIDPLPNDDFGGDGPATGPITIVTPPTNGTATVNDGGTPNDPTDDTIDYTPNPDYNGPDQIVYEICDANGDCVQATIDIDVTPENDLPDAVDDPVTALNEDSPGVNIDVLNNDTFGGDGPSTGAITIVTPPLNGTATVNDGGTPNDPSDDSVDYVPNANYNGPDQFTYEICDSNGDCDQAVAPITVNPVNDFPNAVNDLGLTTPEDTPLNIDPLINDTFGGDGPSTGTITITVSPLDGTATVNNGGTPNDPTDDTIDYVPDPNFHGNDLIVYEICDSNGDCDEATISITVTPVDDFPVAEDDMATVPEDGSVNVDPLPNDDFGGDGPILGAIQIITPPTNGTATVNNGGTPFDPTDDTIDYTPAPDYNGPDQLVYQICDADGDCDPAVISISVLKRELQVEKVGTVDLGANNTLDVGDVINYQITVENTGDVAISNIVVTDPNADGGVTDCAPFTLLPGESMVCNAVHTITAADISAGSVTNTATATGQDPNGADVSDDSDDPNNPADVDPDQDGEPDDPTVTTLPCVTIEAWVYLEGAAIDPSGLVNYTVPMRTDLNDLRLLPGQLLVDPFFGNTYTPAGQPYSIAPWNYFGTEGDNFDSMNDPMFADAGYPSTVVDWVLVSLRDNPNGTGGPICQAAALLHNDGRIEFVDEFSCCALDPQQSYYLVIEHRNHLIVMSHEPIDIVNNTITYDFRTQQSYLVDPFGFGFVGQKEILPGVWAMHAGNGNQTLSGQSDTDINFDDRTYWEGENGELGQYRIGDYNLNGDTNFNDRIQWELNNGKFTSVPRD